MPSMIPHSTYRAFGPHTLAASPNGCARLSPAAPGITIRWLLMEDTPAIAVKDLRKVYGTKAAVTKNPEPTQKASGGEK